MGFPVACPKCGVRFALGLLKCPRCQTVSPQYAKPLKEDAVPRITVAAGPTNAGALPGEVGYVPPGGPQAPGVALVAEHGPELTDLPSGGHVEPVAAHEDVAAPAPEAPAVSAVTEGAEPDDGARVEGSAPDYNAMTVAQLRDEAKAKELPVGGSKAELVARLTAHGQTTTDAPVGAEGGGEDVVVPAS
jgi:hypothetical protein